MQFVSPWVPGSCLRRLGLCCREYLYVTPVAPRKGTVTLLQPGLTSDRRGITYFTGNFYLKFSHSQDLLHSSWWFNLEAKPICV